MKPVDAIAGCLAAHRALLATVDGIDAATLHRPSALPGWTVAHVVAHLLAWLFDRVDLPGMPELVPIG